MIFFDIENKYHYVPDAVNMIPRTRTFSEHTYESCVLRSILFQINQ